MACLFGVWPRWQGLCSHHARCFRRVALRLQGNMLPLYSSLVWRPPDSMDCSHFAPLRLQTPRAVLKKPVFVFFFWRTTALKDSAQGSPTANRQPPPTPNRRQPPTPPQLPTTNRRQPPSTANHHQPPTANRQPSKQRRSHDHEPESPRERSFVGGTKVFFFPSRTAMQAQCNWGISYWGMQPFYSPPLWRP